MPRQLKLDASFFVVQFLAKPHALAVVHRSWIVFTKKPYECWWPGASAAVDVVTTRPLPHDLEGWSTHKCDLKLDASMCSSVFYIEMC